MVINLNIWHISLENVEDKNRVGVCSGILGHTFCVRGYDSETVKIVYEPTYENFWLAGGWFCIFQKVGTLNGFKRKFKVPNCWLPSFGVLGKIGVGA